MWKRFFDIIVSVVGLVILSPFMFLAALAIIITDGFPIIFKQERAGLHGKMFTIYKFRSMTNVLVKDATADLGNTNRITRVGAILRKTKFDEVPQLFNVLKGDMSIVGPRPELSVWLNSYADRWVKVHSVKPGITDNASIVYRNEEELLASADNPKSYYRDEILPHKLSMYEDYVDNHGLWYDIRIILKTIGVVLGKSYDKV